MHVHASRAFLAVSLVVLTSCGSGSREDGGRAAGSEGKVLHVYNWADYIGESTIADFEARTGIKVTYDVYDSNEVLETKLLTGQSGYDVVFPAGSFLQRDIPAGVFLKLDKSKLPNLAHMDPRIMRLVEAHDPGNVYAVNYLWGTTGIGYNPDMVEEVLGTRTIDSWSAVFDPAIASKLAECGIEVLDSAGDVFSLVRLYLGLDVNSESTADLEAVEAVLTRVRPYVRHFDSSRYISDLANGEICVAIGWSGGVLQARSRGAQAAQPVEVAYAIPREGAPIWFDMVAIPADAPSPDEAHAYINFLMEPQVIAGVTNKVGQPSGNADALPYVDAKLRTDRAVYPSDEDMKRLHTYGAPSEEYTRNYTRAWMRIRTGQ